MALYELDQVAGYQDLNDLKTMQAAASEPANLGVNEVWLHITGAYNIPKRYTGSASEVISGVQFKDNTGGQASNLCLQTGRTSNPSGGTITFSLAFSTTPRVIAFCESNANTAICWVVSGSITTTGFQTINLANGGQGSGCTVTVQWVAVGTRNT